MTVQRNYAPLDADELVDPAYLGTGTPDGTKFLRDDQSFAVPPGSGVTDHGALTGLADDDHPQYATDTDLSTHAAASDPHTGYRLESASILPADLDVSADNTTADATTGHHGLLQKLGGGSTNYLRADGTWAAPSGSGAPASVDYLVGTADGGLSAEIVVGTAPGGELGGTWASPTVDATHSGSAHHAQSHDHSAAGDGQTLTPGHLDVPQEAPGTTEGRIGWDATAHKLTGYDTQRALGLGSVGWAPLAFPITYVSTATHATALSLPAAGGSAALPILLTGHMLLQTLYLRNTDAASARTWGWDLYIQDLNNGNAGENTLRRVAASNGNETFTPGAASTRTLAAGSPPIYLAPGLYWLVIQNRHASNTFGLGTTAVSNPTPAGILTKTTTNPNGATLDLVAATWTAQFADPGVFLVGRVFGQTTAYQ